MSIRRRRVSELLSSMDDPQVAVLLDQVVSNARGLESGVYLDFMAAVLFDPGLDYRRRRDVYEAMIGLGFVDNAPIMLETPDRYAEFPFYDLEDMPLGVRKAKARTRDRDLLIRLCRDRDPDVIEILLKNPVLTQAEVLRIVSMRPQSGKVLKRVFCNARWAYRDNLITALVLNKWAPTGLAMALVPVLGLKTLKDVKQDRTLHKLVREMAARVYKASLIRT